MKKTFFASFNILGRHPERSEGPPHLACGGDELQRKPEKLYSHKKNTGVLRYAQDDDFFYIPGLLRRLLTGFTAVVVLSGVFAASQMIDLSAPAPKPKQFISYTAEEQVVKAGKKSWVEMHFHVIDGYHVNSHTPLTELQIPTVLKLDAADGIKFESVQYPAGAAYVIEDGTKLDVYSGMFAVRIPVVASAGMHTVNGTLRYQACDGGSCFPPRNLPVQLLLTAK